MLEKPHEYLSLPSTKSWPELQRFSSQSPRSMLVPSRALREFPKLLSLRAQREWMFPPSVFERRAEREMMSRAEMQLHYRALREMILLPEM